MTKKICISKQLIPFLLIVPLIGFIFYSNYLAISQQKNLRSNAMSQKFRVKNPVPTTVPCTGNVSNSRRCLENGYKCVFSKEELKQDKRPPKQECVTYADIMKNYPNRQFFKVQYNPIPKNYLKHINNNDFEFDYLRSYYLTSDGNIDENSGFFYMYPIIISTNLVGQTYKIDVDCNPNNDTSISAISEERPWRNSYDENKGKFIDGTISYEGIGPGPQIKNYHFIYSDDLFLPDYWGFTDIFYPINYGYIENENVAKNINRENYLNFSQYCAFSSALNTKKDIFIKVTLTIDQDQYQIFYQSKLTESKESSNRVR